MKEFFMNVDVIMLILSVITFVLGRYVVPNIPSSVYLGLKDAFEEVDLVVKWANKYVSWARRFLSEKSGSEKMDYVVAAINQICMKYGIDMDDEQIQAIVQECYDNLIGNNKPETIESETVENK